MKRHATAIALCLLTGMGLTLLIAWTLAVTVDVYAKVPDKSSAEEYGDWHWSLTRQNGFGSVRISSAWRFQFLGRTVITPEAYAPRWARLHEPPSDEFIEENRLIDARGWPWIAFSCDVYRFKVRPPREVVDSQHVVHGLRTPLSDWNPTRAFPGARPARSPRVLPYRPVWGGLTANTLLYAAILWIAFGARRQFIVWCRRRRGQCVNCAYPRGASPVCTECGNPV